MKKLIRIGVGAKLIGLIAALLVVSTVGLVWVSNRLFVEDNRALIQQMNADTASNLSAQVRETLGNLADKCRLIGLLLLEKSAPGSREALLESLYTMDPDLLGFAIFEGPPSNPRLTQTSSSKALRAVGGGNLKRLFSLAQSEQGFSLGAPLEGRPEVGAIRLADGSVAIAIALPLVRAPEGERFSHGVVGLAVQERLSRVFTQSALVDSFLVNSQGRYLAHADAVRANRADTATHLGIVAQLLEGKHPNGQTVYSDPESGVQQLGAYRMVGLAGLGVVAQVPEAKAFEAARRVQYRALLVAVAVLSIAFLIGYFYSDTITWPIRQLVEATRRVAAGEFETRLAPQSKDEIGELTVAFNEMTQGLLERERVKATFNKFHNKEVAEKLLSGDVRLGGERREATIFFSDIRGFTSLSESLEPEQVVEMINEYMSCMVAVIRKHNGIVDKYVGDAIMALWGVPLDNAQSAFDAVSACLEMRTELAKLNASRISRSLPPLRIGMGLNTGPVIAGNIGSDEKMEYTVIGDSVNVASRIESMTKEFGTDLLIAKALREKLHGQFIFEPCDNRKVKGKTQAVETFKVLGRIVDGKPEMVLTPYSEYTAEKSDKIESENKAA